MASTIRCQQLLSTWPRRLASSINKSGRRLAKSTLAVSPVSSSTAIVSSLEATVGDNDNNHHHSIPAKSHAAPIQVKTYSRKQIPTEATNHNVRLTLTDVHLKDEQLPFGYFFKERLDPQLLETSLKKVLKYFPILGGTIHKDGLSIQCTEDDQVSMSFGNINVSLQDWLDETTDTAANRSYRDHIYQTGEHPILLPVFDSIFDKYDDQDNDNDRLATIRVTYFECGGTAIGVNMSHVLGDTASCVSFVQCWGREMRGKTYPRGACQNRRHATTSVMMTEELAEIMSYGKNKAARGNVSDSDVFSRMRLAFQETMQSFAISTEEEGPADNKLEDSDTAIDHEYVRLQFPPEVLTAMKAHGMMTCDQSPDGLDNSYISTNDMVTAFGWLVKRAISGNDDWDLSVVLNMRGRFGVDNFSDMTTMNYDNNKISGVFGNGITNVIAQFRSTLSLFGIDDVSQAAMSIRQSLHQGHLDIPDRISQSRMGRDSSSPSSYSLFATTSWSQFPVWNIKFSPSSELVGFHGHPAHPLPTGQTFSSVIMSTPDGGCIYKLLLPRDKVEESRALHQVICRRYMEWYYASLVLEKTVQAEPEAKAFES